MQPNPRSPGCVRFSWRTGRRASLVLALFLVLGSLAAAEKRTLPDAAGRNTVALLETSAPFTSEFLLRGTFPVPPLTVPRADGREPFTVLDYDGTPVVTQTEIVSRYARESDGADVVEVIARVRRDPRVEPGTPVHYAVLGLGGPEVGGATQDLPQSVLDLLHDPNGIEIATWDCFGNKYLCRPLDGSGAIKFMRAGPVHTELRVYQSMRPRAWVGGPRGTLPHFFGVHSYISTFQDSSDIGLDLRFNNGHDGHDTTSPLDDPLDRVYFEKIEVTLPAGWTLQQDVADPFFGSSRELPGGRRAFALVEPLSNGKLHVMRWQGQFHRRLMISPVNTQGYGRALLNGNGRAFCVRDFDPVDGHEYWSWWNRDTSRYFPQRHQLPSLDHAGVARIRRNLERLQNEIVEHLRTGSANGTYPFQEHVLGWGHPYGVPYGGMTGGTEIYLYDGVTTASAASRQGYRYYTLLHRMSTDRMPTALYAENGQPSSVEQWLVDGPGNNDYVPFFHFLQPFLFSSYNDPFGFRQAPKFQVNYVQANGLQPIYEQRHLLYDPYDYQHFIRYTRTAKVLVWLGNDSLAKDDLRLQAENFNLSYHQYANDRYMNFQASGLRESREFVADHPGQGVGFGRGEAWGADCMISAYAVADPEWRAAKRPWFEHLARLLFYGQASCSGFIQSFVSEKAVDGRYRARQQIEQSITENMLVGLHESVFRFADPPHAAMVRDVLEQSLRSFISEMAWFPGQNGPWRYTGVGPLNIDLPSWCSRAEMPFDAWTAGDIETFQDWSSFAYGFELTGEARFLTFARRQFPGSTNLKASLVAEGTENIENMAALLALVQRLGGEL